MGDDFVQLSETGTNATPTLNELIDKLVDCDIEEQAFDDVLNQLHHILGTPVKVDYIDFYFDGTRNVLRWAGSDEAERKKYVINYIYVTMGTFK